MTRDDYLQTVLKPAWELFKKSGELPDYFRRFNLPETVSSLDEIEKAISEVSTHWTGLLTHPKYWPLIKALQAPAALREATDALRDPAKREVERQRLAALRGQHRAAKLKDLEDSLRVVLSKGYLTSDEFLHLLAEYQKRGLTREDIEGRIKAPVREPESKPSVARLADAKMDQIATHLAVLGNDAVYRNLWTFLRTNAESSKAEIQTAYDAKRKEWEPRPADNLKTSAQTLLGYVKTYLIDGDPASYESARRYRDADNRLLPQILLAGIDGRIGRDEYAVLVELANQCALPEEFTHEYIAEVARERHLGLEVVPDPSPRRQCPICFALNPENARHCHNTSCAEPLFEACPRCDKEHPRAEAVCPHCGCRIAHYWQLEQLKGHLRSALDTRDLVRARQLGSEIEQLAGRAGDVAPLFTELERRLKWIEEQRRKCDEAIDRHALTGALRLLKGMLAEMPDYAWPDGKSAKTRLQEFEKTVRDTEGYLTRARDLERQGQFNDAAAAYSLVLAHVSDHEDALAGLRRCPPDAPREVTVRLSMGNAEITWKASTSRGELAYRVVRSEGRTPRRPDDGKLLARTRDLRVIDASVPAGVPLHYAVFTDRAEVVSPAAIAPPVLETRELEGLSLVAGDGFIQGTWHPPLEGARVRVFRASGQPPRSTEGQELPLSTPTSFQDVGLPNGQAVGYRVLLEYLGPDGAAIRTPGVVATATPEEPPQAVTDLVLTPGEHGLELAWTPPRRGTVALFKLEQAPTWRQGDRVTGSELAALGQPLPIPTGASRHVVPTIESGRHAFLAVTLLGDQALVGSVREFVALEDVGALEAQDFGSFLQLSWRWPDLCTQALVCWRSDRAPDGPEDPRAESSRITRGEYLAQGGFRLEAPGAHPHHFVVYAAGVFDARTLLAPGLGSSCRASLRQTERSPIRYELRPALFNRRKLTVKLVSPDGGFDCPELVLVAKRGSDRPVAVDDGVVIATLPRRSLEAGSWTEHPLELALLPRPVSLRLFFRDRADYDRYRLEEPPAAQMKVK